MRHIQDKNKTKQKPKIKYERGAIVFVAKKMNIPYATAQKRVQRGMVSALKIANQWQIQKKKKLEAALEEYIEVKKYNPIPEEMEHLEDIWN